MARRTVIMTNIYKGKHKCSDIDRILEGAERTAANVDYIAMMTDISIDEETEDANDE